MSTPHQGEAQERDPRVNPKVGDVVWYGGRFEVVAIDSIGNLNYKLGNGTRHHGTTVKVWAEFIKYAEVLHRAD